MREWRKTPQMNEHPVPELWKDATAEVRGGSGRRRDGWAHLAAVIDCHDRQFIGYEFALRGRAKEAERPLDDRLPLITLAVFSELDYGWR